MSEQKHTPGPWKVDPDGMGTPWNVFAADGEIDVAMANDLIGDALVGRPVRTANAHLIAAAPELLEALKALVDDIGSGTNHTCPPECIVCAAHRAIAKAEGRS